MAFEVLEMILSHVRIFPTVLSHIEITRYTRVILGRLQGSSNFSRLTDKGERQAATTHKMLEAEDFDALYHSPLARSSRTAEVVWGSRAGHVEGVAGLREVDLYSFQGLIKEEGKATFREAYVKWQKDPANFEIDGHFPVRELWYRGMLCWHRILTMGEEQSRVLVVGHNAINQAMICTALGLPVTYFRRILQSNAAVTALDFLPCADAAPRVVVDRLNSSPDSPFAKQLGSAGRPTKARLVLVCHAATTDSRSDELLSGTGDEKCSVQGLREAEQTAELLLDVEVGQLVCSPRLCARQTAQAIAAKRGEAAPEVQVETAIDAMDLGDWTGLSARQVRGSSLAANAEAIESVWNRTREVYTRLCAAANRVGTVVVVGHAASHSAMLCQALGVGMDAIPTFRLESASVSIIEFPDGAVDGDGVLRCTNYTSHIMQKDRP
eukprot:gene13103-15474_t